MPERFSIAPENDLVGYEIRQCSMGLGSRGGYRAVYAIADDRVLVLTVRLSRNRASRQPNRDL